MQYFGKTLHKRLKDTLILSDTRVAVQFTQKKQNLNNCVTDQMPQRNTNILQIITIFYDRLSDNKGIKTKWRN